MKWKIENYVKKQLGIAVCLNLGPILNGYATGWSAPMVPILGDPEKTPLSEPLTAMQSSWLGSLLFLGFFASLISGYLANIVGRRPCFIGGAVFAILSYALLVNPNKAGLFVARMFQSVYTSVNLTLTLVYMGEIASSNIRGMILTSTALSQNFGCIVVYVLGAYVPYTAVQYIAIALTVVYIVIVLLIPESPMFFLMKGDEKSLEAALHKLGRAEDISQLLASSDEFKKSHTSNTPFRELFTIKSNRKAFYITGMLFTLQFTSGVITVILFATTIFSLAGSSIDPNISTIIIGIICTAGSVVSPIFVDRYGRRILLLISTFGCSLCMALLGIYFYMASINESSVDSVKWLPLFLMIISFLVYSIGLASIPNTLLGEMYAPNVRSVGSGVSILISGILGFASSNFSFGYLLDTFGMHSTFSYFAIINALGFLFTLIFVPETKGLSLLAVEKLLD